MTKPYTGEHHHQLVTRLRQRSEAHASPEPLSSDKVAQLGRDWQTTARNLVELLERLRNEMR